MKNKQLSIFEEDHIVDTTEKIEGVYYNGEGEPLSWEDPEYLEKQSL